MSKYNEIIDELDLKLDRLKQKVKNSKILFKNNIDASNEIVFSHNIYGTNKVLAYDITVLGTSQVNIIVKFDDVVLSASQGVLASGEVLLKANKLYSMTVVCTGENMLGVKLALEAGDLRII